MSAVQWYHWVLILLVNDVLLGGALTGIGFLIKKRIEHNHDKKMKRLEHSQEEKMKHLENELAEERARLDDQLARERARDEARQQKEFEIIPQLLERAEELRMDFATLSKNNPRQHSDFRIANLDRFSRFVPFCRTKSIYIGKKLQELYDRFNGIAGSLLILFAQMKEEERFVELSEKAQKQHSKLDDTFELIRQQSAKDLGAQEEEQKT